MDKIFLSIALISNCSKVHWNLLTGLFEYTTDQMSPWFNENGSIQEENADCALRMFTTGWSNCAT